MKKQKIMETIEKDKSTKKGHLKTMLNKNLTSRKNKKYSCQLLKT